MIVIKQNKTLFINLIVLIAINVLASKLYFRLDLTEEKKYSLNDATKETLNSIDDILLIRMKPIAPKVERKFIRNYQKMV
ncbi:MAG: hypothetical protein EBY39_08615 [Flavobacteriia bacterium]|nr:hypothetical protein [Flavobacteriia bacterium]